MDKIGVLNTKRDIMVGSNQSMIHTMGSNQDGVGEEVVFQIVQNLKIIILKEKVGMIVTSWRNHTENVHLQEEVTQDLGQGQNLGDQIVAQDHIIVHGPVIAQGLGIDRDLTVVHDQGRGKDQDQNIGRTQRKNQCHPQKRNRFISDQILKVLEVEEEGEVDLARPAH